MGTNKNGYIANFNLTFGQKHEPLLHKLEEVILPALMLKNEDRFVKLNKNSPTFFLRMLE